MSGWEVFVLTLEVSHDPSQVLGVYFTLADAQAHSEIVSHIWEDAGEKTWRSKSDGLEWHEIQAFPVLDVRGDNEA